MGDLHTIGVIGAGQMGRGIAQTCIMSGLDVLLGDIDDAAARAAVDKIGQTLGRQAERGKIDKPALKAALARLSCASALADFARCDLVVESIVEDEAAKRALLEQICGVLPAQTVIASNTSSISITRLAAATDRAERFIGIHFMNPVPVMELVEIVRGIATGNDTFELARRFAEKCGKTVALAEDYPAFMVNRILLPMINEAVYTLYEGVGGVESIDTAMRLGAHHPMGPLQLADFIGLDTCLSIMQVLHDGLADSKYRPCPLLVKYVEAGWLGRKTKRGFYDYRGDEPVPTR